MKKKILSLVLALLMTASSASAILADDVAIDEDVEAISAIEEEVAVAGQYDNAIKFLNQYGIFKGKSADDLGAEDMLERYQMALFVSRIATGWVDDEQWEDGPENWSEFTDISEGPVANYWGALSYANSQGIIEGYGNGKFGPTDGITYQNALTMVVRTLGYQGLEWPWGYIQKAVELGLTEGITGITYQDELNRGEVAQIIYNALFATTKSGSTLAMKSFGIEFGWEKVVITASDLDLFTVETNANNTGDKKVEKTAIAKNDAYGYTGWKNSDKTAAGYVGFKILADDGSLSDDTYYMLASDIGLSDELEAHDDEAVVGDSYYILFEKDADSNLVKTVAYESLLVDTLKNEGKTDDDGEAQDYAIKEFLEDYKFVSKYSGNSYVNVTASGKNELLVYTATSTITEKVVDGNYIAIDWVTGDILRPVYDDKNDNGKYDDGTDTLVYDVTDAILYQVEWYYNDLLDKYYKIDNNVTTTDKNTQIDNKYSDKDDVDYWYGIDYMSDAEFEKTYKEFIKWAEEKRDGYKLIDSNPATSAYAELKLYDTNLDGVADRGLYETYRLGLFKQDTANCDHKQMIRYNISNVSAYDQSEVAVKAIDGEKASIALGTVSAFAEGDSCGNACRPDRVWFAEGYEPLKNYDDDGEVTGYKEGYVIYTYDSETGEIKVVKNIDDGSDVDTFSATGVLRAYNLNKGTVTIDDTQYSIKDYDELIGNAFRYVTKNYKTRAAYSDLFRALFNQFVEYVVVDGELVNVRAKSADRGNVIIVDSYAGLSSDGYIVVNGYHTAELKYDQFRIGSYDGWQKGDYYYYLNDDKVADSFTKGTIYSISSYDSENEVYYVELAGQWNKNYRDYIVEDHVTLNNVTIKADAKDGYMTYKKNNGDENYRKMASSDKYVIIPEHYDERKPVAPLYVYEGILPAGAQIVGKRINSDDYSNTTYIIVNANTMAKDENGNEYNTFPQLMDTYKSGLVLLLNDSYIEADYNGADAEDDRYLLGASKYVVEAFDLMTGDIDHVYAATNLDLEVGHVYFTQDGVATEDLGVQSVRSIPAIMNSLYPMNGTKMSDDATYAYGSFKVTEKNITTLSDLFWTDKDKNNETRTEKIELDKLLVNDDTLTTGKLKLSELLGYSSYRDNIDSVSVWKFEYETKKAPNSFGGNQDVFKPASVDQLTKLSHFEKLVDDWSKYEIYANWIYDIAGQDVVIYLNMTDGSRTEIKDNPKDELDLIWSNEVKIWSATGNDDVYITAQIGYTYETETDYDTPVLNKDGKYVNKQTVTATISAIRLAYAGSSLVGADHEAIQDKDWYFGIDNSCFLKGIMTNVSVAFADGTSNTTSVNMYDVIVDEIYDDHKEVDGAEYCNLAQSIIIPLTGISAITVSDDNEDFDTTKAEWNWAKISVTLTDDDDEDEGTFGATAKKFVVSAIVDVAHAYANEKYEGKYSYAVGGFTKLVKDLKDSNIVAEWATDGDLTEVTTGE